MATLRCVEMGKLKCVQYWPDGDGIASYGELNVQCTSFHMCEGYELRMLRVQCRVSQNVTEDCTTPSPPPPPPPPPPHPSPAQGVTRTLMHYQFTAWPDYGVPSGGDSVLSLIYAAREMQGRYAEYVRDPHHHPLHGPPVVIHCSAGICRSGSFCALDYCIDELREKGKVNVQMAVRHLRSQRAFAIQTDEQYEFCYRTVLEYALSLRTAMRT